MILHYSLAILNTNDNALSLLFLLMHQCLVCIVYFHLVHIIITSNVGIILDVQFIVMSTKKVLENSIEGLLPEP